MTAAASRCGWPCILRTASQTSKTDCDPSWGALSSWQRPMQMTQMQISSISVPHKAWVVLGSSSSVSEWVFLPCCLAWHQFGKSPCLVPCKLAAHRCATVSSAVQPAITMLRRLVQCRTACYYNAASSCLVLYSLTSQCCTKTFCVVTESPRRVDSGI